MSVAGGIGLTVLWDGRVVRSASVASTRPAAARLLPGRSPAEAEAMVALLFGVCGRAQTVAAANAIAAARGVVTPRGVVLQREAALCAEAIHELAWRILIDLPLLAGDPPQPERLAALREQLQRLPGQGRHCDQWWHEAADDDARRAWTDIALRLKRLLAKHVFGVAPAEWLEMASLDSLESWIGMAPTRSAGHLGAIRAVSQHRSLGRSAVALLPRLGAADAAGVIPGELLFDEAYASAPTWRGAAAETGALARTKDHPLVAEVLAAQGNTVATRLLARFVELALLPRRLACVADGRIESAWAANCSPAPARGLSLTETARGMLLHQVELREVDGERIARYGIVAPTEWNFHPAGAFVHGITGVEAASRAGAAQAAQWLAHSLDPCVACKVEVVNEAKVGDA
jgi:hypothetical protein